PEPRHVSRQGHQRGLLRQPGSDALALAASAGQRGFAARHDRATGRGAADSSTAISRGSGVTDSGPTRPWRRVGHTGDQRRRERQSGLAVVLVATFQFCGGTMTVRKPKSARRVLVAACAAVLGTAAGASATIQTWNGGGADDHWTTSGNWIGRVKPLAGDSLLFDGPVRLTPTNYFAPATSFTGL